MAKRRKRRDFGRIYYGTNNTKLFWKVKINNATKDVVLNGSLLDAIKGKPGQTIGCHLSNCALRNQSAFPHPVHMAAFTRSSALVVDKITDGRPSHAVRYRHQYAALVDLNDTDHGKSYLKKHPEVAEREFILRKPVAHKSAPVGSGGKNDTRRSHSTGGHRVPRGALRRAQAAGLITADLAKAIK